MNVMKTKDGKMVKKYKEEEAGMPERDEEAERKLREGERLIE